MNSCSDYDENGIVASQIWDRSHEIIFEEDMIACHPLSIVCAIIDGRVIESHAVNMVHHILP
jgi:hypothetical protein